MMRYLTPRKRAEGRGSAHAGAHHHWSMMVSSVALAFLVPVWLWIFGRALGGTQDQVVETFARPFPAILTALLLVVGMRHFAMGATTMIEDYARGTNRKMLIIFVICLSTVIAATGLFALARIAL
jgi:succinate dehydrogenase / fumarate reductase, membrane anchor subunit